MKHGKKPTREQRIFLEGKRMNADDWLIVKNTPQMMELVHRHFDNVKRIIHKESYL